MWRVMLGVSSALLTASMTCLFAAVAFWFANEPTYMLGYPGSTVRIIAVGLPGSPGAAGLVDELDAEKVSMAYAPSSSSRLVTLFDPKQRFVDQTGTSLYAPLQRLGPNPAALVSTAAPRDDDGYTFLDKDVTIAGSFVPRVKFEFRYPVVLQNVAAGVPAAGVYLLAGVPGGSEGSLVDLFSRHGLEVVHLEIQGAASPWELFSSPFGVVIAVFALLSIAAAGFVARIHVTGLRGALAVAVVLGAEPRDLKLLVVRRVVPVIAIGAAVGSVVALIPLVLVCESVPASVGRAAGALIMGVSVSLLVWGPIVVWIAARESRSALRVLPR